uniref:Midasin n=1 Tax=Echeneis naucrates TaxID=173247 RepID=A0A665V9V2_ECHNA
NDKMENLELSLSSLGTISRHIDKSHNELSQYLSKQIWNQQDRQCILDCLAQLLLEKDYTLLIARHLRPLILDLLERNAERVRSGGRINHDLHERLCVALSKLLSISPDAPAFAAKYFDNAPPVFQRLFFTSEESSAVQYGPRRMKMRDLMGATLRFLHSDCAKFRMLWDWSPCVSQLLTSDVMVRGYTAHCLALVSHMTDNQKNIFLRKVLTNDEILINNELNIVLEKALVLANQGSVMWRQEKANKFTRGQVVSEDLSQNVVAVCGIVLPRISPRQSEQVNQNLVLVDSTCRNLRRLALAVASQKPVLLEGPIGCGKTALVEFVAAVTGHTKATEIFKVQLGDQTDSKMLLGMYRCTDIPGKFVWQPGTLTQAVSKGHWILLEDIDHAPLDVISVLLPLMENKKLMIPGREDCIDVEPGFQFFATRRMYYSGGSWHKPQNSHAVLLDKYWTKLQMGNMTREELKKVIISRYPGLTVVADRLLDIYCQLTGARHTDSGSLQTPDDTQQHKSENKSTPLEGRALSLRDLLKWCERISINFDSTSSGTAQHVFQEALDCFTAMLSQPEARLRMAEIIGSKLNISKEKAQHFCQMYQPGISLTELEVSVGRVTLCRKQTEAVQLSLENQTFAATRPSAVLLEQLAVCVFKGEPALLVGETGTGKTSTVQHLARATGIHRFINRHRWNRGAPLKLVAGYKPVDHKQILLPLREAFEDLFSQTYSRKQNLTFLGHVQTCFRGKRWQDLLKLMDHVCKSALTKELQEKSNGSALAAKLSQTQQQIRACETAMVFAFVEGTLAQAVKKGHWVLLDEINLASAETLECLSGLLEGSSGSLVLLDRGDTEPLVRHPDFRLFACMNPATDVGKRNLPLGLRNRFTELYVDELENEGDLRILVSDYLKYLNPHRNVISGIISFYLAVRKEASSHLVDGTGRRPHYSLRTLCRALKYVAANPCNSVQRSLYEGFCLSFLTQLDRSSHPVVQKLVCQHILMGNTKCLKHPIPAPSGQPCVEVEAYWVSQGEMEPALDPSYILTTSVKLNLHDLARVVSAGTHPVLIQGETSVGKTSLICWLAAATGNQCVRINNHEHTDIQEYIGCYSSDDRGKLVFKEGVLIDAMRKGYWIILDELNLAPTDVLEALNRLLDDNRELFVAETQEVIKAHPRFKLFATQNPPGLYGGRKVLSRAFRNRFVELHFDDLPSAELETILNQRCHLPPSYCTKLVKVMQDLQSLRRGSSVFAGKHGFITLRDLFRWADRYRLEEQTEASQDWLQHLADDGYMLLAGRVRKPEEEAIILSILEKHFKRTVNPENLFSQKQVTSQFSDIAGVPEEFRHVVWTQGMKRLAVLVGRALRFGESVLLVGDTGCGKTTICQLFAALASQKFFSVNCHLHMETSDFLGGLRPPDGEDSRLFQWHDGPLVLAMREGGVFLMDEISLADDSVLERLNSVLETEKSLVLAEKGSGDNDNVELIRAAASFRLVATMNPGGDFGKKELSPALRNRFTEIWCPQSNSRSDLVQIIQHNLRSGLSLDGCDIAELMLDFIEWLTRQDFGRRCILSIRDILSWVNFLNTVCELDTVTAFIHAACLVYIDGIGSGTTVSYADNALLARRLCLSFLQQRLSKITKLDQEMMDALRVYDSNLPRKPQWGEDFFGIDPFYIALGTESRNLSDYAIAAGTTAMNAQRLLRALKLQRPVLLEGAPGVGKTSLVAALAKASGNHLVRINLSEQTDVTDLFGTDLPVEGGKGGEFAWRDGPLLAALKAGHWVVLDELNLASQSVLEGLNACFDHRAEIYIPELGMSFHVQHEKTKIFGCQNPFTQGGGRKGLPKSFLNRFTQVFVDQLTSKDMEFIADSIFPRVDKEIIAKMVEFSNRLVQEVCVERGWGQKGSPWEFNLRDMFRWCQLMQADQSPGFFSPGQHVALVYADRMRTEADKVLSVFRKVFGEVSEPYSGSRQFHITPLNVQVGFSVLQRSGGAPVALDPPLSITHQALRPLESLMKCVEMGWMTILVGPTSSGKTSLVRLLALLTGHRLRVMAMNSAMDTTELLGGFEQVDIMRPWQQVLESVDYIVAMVIRRGLMSLDVGIQDTEFLLQTWGLFCHWLKDKGLQKTWGTVDSEALNKLEVIILLLQKLNTKLKVFTGNMDFTLLKERLAQLEDGWTNGGFEWLDGMLVQALQAGDWLLMDNVNFCSASVLDRLNALLEPGGSLTINERGVIDGKTPQITPHPNFRLFLTMDPVHGELSRAMRNRGVEVYIPGEHEGVCWDSLDLKTLLHTTGVTGDCVCDLLIEIHKGIKSAIWDSPASSVASLLHAATLLSCQLHRGVDLPSALQHACGEAYSLCQRTTASQKQSQQIIEQHLAILDTEDWGSGLLCAGVWPDGFPSALLSTEDSCFSAVLRDGQVLSFCLNTLSLQGKRNRPLSLNDLQRALQSSGVHESLVFSDGVVDLEEGDALKLIPTAVKLVTERASHGDRILRSNWLSHLGKSYKYAPGLYHLTKECIFPAFTGTVDIGHLPHPVLMHLQAFFDLWNSFILQSILQLLQWLDRFWDICSTLPADSQGISVLSLHWQWVQKHLILRLPQLLLGDADELQFVWCELLSEALAALWTSCVTSDPDRWLKWDPLNPETQSILRSVSMLCQGPALLSKAVWSHCALGVLTSSEIGDRWEPSVSGLLSLSYVTLGEWKERIQQLQDVSAVLWDNMAIPALAEFRGTDFKLQGVVLRRQLQSMADLLPPSLQEGYMESCESLVEDPDPLIAAQEIRTVFRDFLPPNLLPDTLVASCITCLQQYVQSKVQGSNSLVRSGVFWVNMGLLQIKVWTPQTIFDPAVKRAYKLNYAQQELALLQEEWRGRSLSSQLMTGAELEESSTTDGFQHPRIRYLWIRMQQVKEQIAELSRKQACRPHEPQYGRLFQELQHYLCSIGQVSRVEDLLSHLLKALQDSSRSRSMIQNLLKEEAVWQNSQQRFCQRLLEDYPLYPDVVGPVRTGILQLRHGMRLVASQLAASLTLVAGLPKLVSCLLAFPSVSSSLPSYLARADFLCSTACMDVLRGLLTLLPQQDPEHVVPQSSTLLLNALLHVQCHTLSTGEFSPEAHSLFRHICQALVNEWDEQERRRREREQQEASLYRSRSRLHGSGLTEDEQEEKDFRCQFPQYNKDFSDIMSHPSLESPADTGLEKEATDQEESIESGFLSPAAMNTVVQVHQRLCLGYSRSLWYQSMTTANHSKDIIKALVSSYQIAAPVMSHAELDQQMTGSALLLSTLLQNAVQGSGGPDGLVVTSEGPYDFYQQPNTSEASLCLPVLEQLGVAVKQRLEDWPDHPALIQLTVVMERILAFSLASPLAKFLNGLEILLSKAQDWENNASRSVSLRKELEPVTQLIIQWRKLELSCWSSSLDNAMRRCTENSTKHWFSIYQLVERYLEEQRMETNTKVECLSLSSVSSTLQAFMEGSPLGEFHTRLAMLLSFHCHLLLVSNEPGQESLSNLLWNLHRYYSQFSNSIQTKISQLRQPIEKELKDFVKISKWNDISFWSIKQSVEKTHRTLFKFVKKFEEVLRGPSIPALVEQESSTSLDSQDSNPEDTPVHRVHRALKSTLPGKALVPLKMAFNFFFFFYVSSGEVISNLQDLQSLTTDMSAEKEKQKAEVKHILQQKQRALSDLFKMLTEIGLSYRKGLMWNRTADPEKTLCIQPLEMNTHVNQTHQHTLYTDKLLSAWDGCQKYFYRSWARKTALLTALQHPAKELGLGNVERCRGFSSHLFKLLLRQRQRFAKLTERWIRLRRLTSSIQGIKTHLQGHSKDPGCVLPPQAPLQAWVSRGQVLAAQCTTLLQQVAWLLQCCPEDLQQKEETSNCRQHTLRCPSPLAAQRQPPGCLMRRGDAAWCQLHQCVTAMLKQTEILTTFFFHRNHFGTCCSGFDQLAAVVAQMPSVEQLFIPAMSVGSADSQPAITQSLQYVRGQVEADITEFTTWKTQLLSLGHQHTGECANKEEDDEEPVDDLLKPGHLARLLEEGLEADVEALSVGDVNARLQKLLVSLMTHRDTCQQEVDRACRMLVRLEPLLGIYSDLVRYYMAVSLGVHRSTGKLLSVLASIFTDLAQKGFCLPQELMAGGDGEGATEFHDYEGGGIGEGEGNKDVSDKIENEDQVEDTSQEGQEKEEQQDKGNIKAEDNAIEMSEDFDGQMHDGDENEPDSEKEDEEELDKKMGDLGEGQTDTLDERMWGDDEDDQEEEGSDKEEESGQGMDQGESELVAKDDNLDAADPNKDKKNQDKDQEMDIEEKEKIHEQGDEREFDENEVDPYHGQQDKRPEPEAMDLPEDLNLDEDEEARDDGEGEEDNPLDIDEKAMELDEKEDGEGDGEEDGEEEQGAEETQQGQSDQPEEEKDQEPKAEEDDGGEGDTEKAEGDEDSAEKDEEEERRAQEARRDEDLKVPNDNGPKPKVCEEGGAEDEEQPESAERKEHDRDGQTGEENLQSDSAVELGGEASERDQAKEEHGSGAADASQSEGHQSKLTARMPSQGQTQNKTQSFKRKPGQADNERSTGDYNERVNKRLRTVESSKDRSADSKHNDAQQDSDLYEHIRQGEAAYDTQTYDVASADQQKAAGAQQDQDEDQNDEDVAMETEHQEEDLQATEVQELKPEQLDSSKASHQGVNTSSSPWKDRQHPREEQAERSTESTIHTVPELLLEANEVESHICFTHLFIDSHHLEDNFFSLTFSNHCCMCETAAASMWHQYQTLTSALSQQLCEQLRLILEPTQATKLKGDYRTGKRLNMRKVIPYIASQFRKDKIWLRRTKPSKREYQICLAVDDSSSMVDNHSKQLAFESLSVIINALNLLEVGQVSVCSFGEQVQLLHPFQQQFNDESGARILRLCQFQQKKTRIAQFLEMCTKMFLAARQQIPGSINSETAQLLVIVSDGRGLFLEGKERVRAAVRATRSANVFVIFVVLDNPNSRDSILDIKVPIFKGPGELPEIRSYMEEFPFPFYIILRDVNALPETLSDALRQWFELVTAADQ